MRLPRLFRFPGGFPGGFNDGMNYTAQFVAKHLRDRSAEDYFNQPQFREVMELAATRNVYAVARAYGAVSDDELPLRIAAAAIARELARHPQR